MGSAAATGVQCSAICWPPTSEEDHHFLDKLTICAAAGDICLLGEVKVSWYLLDHLPFLAHCLRYLQELNVSINYLWAALMFVCPMIGAVLYVHSSRLSIIVQIKMRAELTAAVYRKALALSSR